MSYVRVEYERVNLILPEVLLTCFFPVTLVKSPVGNNKSCTCLLWFTYWQHFLKELRASEKAESYSHST